MPASSQPTLVTNAATHGSAQSVSHEAGSTQLSAPIGRENLQANGGTHNLTQQHDVSLPCIGSWTPDGQYQGTDSSLGDVYSNQTVRDKCARHGNIQEACLASTSNVRTIELLPESKTEDVPTRLADGEGGKFSFPVCSCDKNLEVDESENVRSVLTVNGEKGAE